MRVNIKVTDLSETQWSFVQRFVCTEYPLDGTAVRVTYQAAPELEFSTVMPLAKFHEVQGHLGYLGLDPAALAADQAKAREVLDLIRKITQTVDDMREELREVSRG